MAGRWTAISDPVTDALMPQQFKHMSVLRWHACPRGFGSAPGHFLVPKSQRQVPRSATRSPPALRLTPSELSAAVRVASQGENASDLTMWRTYAEAVLFHAGSLSPKHLAFITNGFARAEVPDREVFRRLADRALEQINDFEPRDTALLLNAYAKLAFRDLVLFGQFAKFIRTSPSADVGFSEQHLSLVANAYARLQLEDVKLFETLSKWMKNRFVELTPQAVAVVANAYAKVLIKDVELFRLISRAVERHLKVFSPQHIANLFNAYSRLDIEDHKVFDQLSAKVPGYAASFRPVEISAILGALVKLRVDNRRALNSLAAVVRERTEEFRARQLAASLHSFSLLTTAYGSLFVDVVPQVLACATDADSQGLTMLFCAYARAGQPESQVVRTLIERIEPRTVELESQALVNLFYACGRFALHKEPLAHRLVELLLPRIHGMPAQHAANSLFAAARLKLATDEWSRLVGSLQTRIARGGLAMEPQQCANVLHALAALHGVGTHAADCNLRLPVDAVEAIVQRILDSADNSEWKMRPQLLASTCVSLAILGQTAAPVFGLAGRIVRTAERKPGGGDGVRLSKQCVADFLAAFAAAGFLDVDLFSWCLSQLVAIENRDTVPVGAMLKAIAALDYAAHTIDAEQYLDVGVTSRIPNGGDSFDTTGSSCSLLFLDSPVAFQEQVHSFYLAVGQELLARASQLQAAELESVATAYARAGLLDSATPFDLMGQSFSNRIEEAAARSVPRFPLGNVEEIILDTSYLDVDGFSRAPETVEHKLQETMLDRIFGELGRDILATDGIPSRSSKHASEFEVSSLSRRLSRYATLAATGKWPSHLEHATQVACHTPVPAQALDHIIRRLGEQLASAVDVCNFDDLVSGIIALANAGVWSRDTVVTLMHAVDAKFPLHILHGNTNVDFERTAQIAEDLAKMFHGLHKIGVDASPALCDRLLGVASTLASAVSVGQINEQTTTSVQTFGRRPLRTVAALSAALRRSLSVPVERPVDSATFGSDFAHHPPGSAQTRWQIAVESIMSILAIALVQELLPDLRHRLAIANQSEAYSNRQPMNGFDDLVLLLLELLSPMDGAPTTVCKDFEALRADAIMITALLLTRMLRGQEAPKDMLPTLLIDLLRSFSENSGRSLGPSHLDLFAAIFGRLIQNSQTLGPGGISAALYAVARMRVLDALERPGYSSSNDDSLAVKTAEQRARELCGSPSSFDAGGQWDLYCDIVGDFRGQLPGLFVELLRSFLTYSRRLAPSEAVQGAYFCALALDAQAFSEAERAEVKGGLAQLLERLCWERRRWTLEDRQIVVGIAALLRSEYPELLRDSSWASRSVISTLEELRSSHDSFL